MEYYYVFHLTDPNSTLLSVNQTEILEGALHGGEYALHAGDHLFLQKETCRSYTDQTTQLTNWLVEIVYFVDVCFNFLTSKYLQCLLV